MSMDGSNYRGDTRVTWSELAGGQVTDDLLRAVCGAYALVTCSDGNVTDAEVARFLELVKTNDRFPFINPKLLEAVFRDLTKALFDDPVRGRKLAFGAIEKFKGDHDRAELIIRAAQIGVVADGILEEVEETVLGQICWAVGVDPEGR